MREIRIILDFQNAQSINEILKWQKEVCGPGPVSELANLKQLRAFQMPAPGTS